MNLHELENAADIVCGECVCIDEDTCSTCPVRLTLDRKRGAYYDVVAAVYDEHGTRLDADLLHGGFDDLREARHVKHEYKMMTSQLPSISKWRTVMEIEVHDRTGALLEIIP